MTSEANATGSRCIPGGQTWHVQPGQTLGQICLEARAGRPGAISLPACIEGATQGGKPLPDVNKVLAGQVIEIPMPCTPCEEAYDKSGFTPEFYVQNVTPRGFNIVAGPCGTWELGLRRQLQAEFPGYSADELLAVLWRADGSAFSDDINRLGEGEILYFDRQALQASQASYLPLQTAGDENNAVRGGGVVTDTTHLNDYWLVQQIDGLNQAFVEFSNGQVENAGLLCVGVPTIIAVVFLFAYGRRAVNRAKEGVKGAVIKIPLLGH